jgi:tRNA(fMet)-specific endonuclease VapC
MSTFVLDTNMVLGYIRAAKYAEYVEKKYSVSTPPNIAIISVVTIAEIYSLSLQFGWGDDKQTKLKDILNKIPTVNINHPEILLKYAEIDAYSQGKHPIKKMPDGMTSRNMGKNDVWIAATCSVLNAILLTTDKDFNHLNNVFLHLEFIDPGLTSSDINAK